MRETLVSKGRSENIIIYLFISTRVNSHHLSGFKTGKKVGVKDFHKNKKAKQQNERFIIQ